MCIMRMIGNNSVKQWKPIFIASTWRHHFYSSDHIIVAHNSVYQMGAWQPYYWLKCCCIHCLSHSEYPLLDHNLGVNSVRSPRWHSKTSAFILRWSPAWHYEKLPWGWPLSWNYTSGFVHQTMTIKPLPTLLQGTGNLQKSAGTAALPCFSACIEEHHLVKITSWHANSDLILPREDLYMRHHAIPRHRLWEAVVFPTSCQDVQGDDKHWQARDWIMLHEYSWAVIDKCDDAHNIALRHSIGHIKDNRGRQRRVLLSHMPEVAH